ncbi:uncharacterized protein DS421_4g133130 [Arachis hypogaea]|nr:uncharacterized protein DS421_4g133130 [Arachis hypogaea]
MRFSLASFQNLSYGDRPLLPYVFFNYEEDPAFLQLLKKADWILCHTFSYELEKKASK